MASIARAGDGDELVPARDRVILLRLPTRGFQIGTVDDLDSAASFDPYWLFVDSPPRRQRASRGTRSTG